MTASVTRLVLAIVCLMALVAVRAQATGVGGWSEAGARDVAFGLVAGQPALVRVPVAFTLKPGAFELGLGGGTAGGDPFGLGARYQQFGGRLSAAYGVTQHLTLFGSGEAGRTELLAQGGGPVVVPLNGRVEVGALGGVRLLQDALAVSLSAKVWAPTAGAAFARGSADLLVGWTGPVHLHAQLGFHMADGLRAVSPLAAAASGVWGYDRLEVGAAASLPFSSAALFLEYHGDFAFCGAACPSSPLALLAPSAMPQRISPGLKVAFGPLVLGVGAELSLGHLLAPAGEAAKGPRPIEGVPAPAPWSLLATLSIAPGSMPQRPQRAASTSPRAVKVSSATPAPEQPRAERPRPVPPAVPAAAPLTPAAKTNDAYLLSRPIPDGLGRLLITVIDGATGRTIEGARIAAAELDWTSDADGRALVEVPAGVLQLVVKHRGYEDVTRALAIGRFKARSIAVYLWPDAKRQQATAGIAGVVLDSRGEPLQAVLTIQPFSGAAAMHVEVDGIYDLRLPPGRYAIQARAEKMALAQVELELFSGESRPVDFTLADGQAPSVKVEFGEVAFGEPVAFVPGSDELLPASWPVLDALVLELLQSHRDAGLMIFAYVEPGDDEARDQKLSAARARKVAAYLAQRGLDPARIEAYGGGHSPIIAVGDDRYRNNRIEVLIQEKSK